MRFLNCTLIIRGFDHHTREPLRTNALPRRKDAQHFQPDHECIVNAMTNVRLYEVRL